MAKKVARPKDWRNVEWRPTDVLAFDPALANTGWALVHFYAYPIPPVLGATGTFVTKPEDASSVASSDRWSAATPSSPSPIG